MATYDQLMRAAANAHKAGDQAAAQRLLSEAGKVGRPQATQPAQAMPILPTIDGPYDGLSQHSTKPKDRFGDTISAATEKPFQAVVDYTRAATGQTPTIVGGSIPENVPGREILGRAGDAGMAALSGLGSAYATGAGVVGELFGGSPANERRLARDLMMMGEVAVPQLAGVSGAARGANRAATAAQTVERVRSAPTDKQAVAQAADDLGVTPSLGMRGKLPAMAASGLEKVPFAGPAIARDAVRAVEEIGRAADLVVDGVGSARSPVLAGERLQSSLRGFVKDFKARSAQLYSAVDKHIPDGARVTTDETGRLIQEALSGFEETPEIARMIGLDSLKALAKDLEGGLTWQATRALRTAIGERIGSMNPGELGDVGSARLKSVYGALSKDLDAAATIIGGDAKKAWDRANKYYAAGAKRIDKDVDKLISEGMSAERAFESLANMAKGDRATSDVRKLQRVKASMSKDDWDDFAASVIDRLGRPTNANQSPDAPNFSPSTFLTKWNGLSTEAKATLVDTRTRAELEKLALLARKAKDGEGERDLFNAGTVVAQIGTGAGFASAPLTTTALLLSANISARALTSPVYLKAMNAAARGDMRAMKRLADGKSELRTDAQAVLTVVGAGEAGDPAQTEAPMRAIVNQR